ncbi:hypothetical protein JQ609_17205 [Bradyrhizobium sp. AUGA SZCCT0169]|uniref:hypothetical protein n=1 Tax=Bradyrhizobium sp. AUGA SZCCT0169 TaxID=2807663 RepID=UPI001BAD585B|nr:hypothetical protein [Bradyrhizobium sp. AUGA SZCCT0169]MBR1248663.1 hypothetical protein [Bradyrhizobium sp. AUGA SZCCT0169]
MSRAAKAFAWIALVYGAPPMLLLISALFEGGWRIFVFLGLIALPLLPLILMQDARGWRTPSPGVPLAVAVVSLVATTLLYLRLFGVIQWSLPWDVAG